MSGTHRTIRRTPDSATLAVLVAVLLGLAGCVGPSVTSDGAGARVGNGVGSTARSTDGQGTTWETSTTTAQVPTNVVADGQGLNQQTSGPHRTLAVSRVPDGTVTMVVTDPLDGSLEGFEYDAADGTTIRLARVESQPSVTIAAWNDQTIAALRAAEVISELQAGVVRDAIAAGASLGEALAGVLAPGFGG